MEERFVVYENWRAEQKAVVHNANCGHAKEASVKLTNNWLINNNHPNDRWFGYFNNLDEASKFAELLPNRPLKFCNVCLKIK